MEIRPLDASDVDAAMRLSTQAGWNQVPADWERLIELAPESCFAGWVDGELIATSTLVTYGTDVGWIGMVLVDEGHRRRGYGSRLFERALAAGTERDLRAVGLDATDAGRTVYEQYDFVPVCPIERWGGTPAATADAASAAAVGGEAVDELAAFDRRACGTDRGAFLASLLEDRETTGLAVRDGDAVQGYGVLRPGRTRSHLGPVVAADARTAETLVAAAAERVDGGLFVDLLDTDRAGVLERAGLSRERELVRMVHETPTPALVGDDVFAAAGFEWG